LCKRIAGISTALVGTNPAISRGGIVPDDMLQGEANSVADAIRRLEAASEAMSSAVGDRDGAEVADAKRQLAQAVGDAREIGVSWQTVGDALGMRRGAAYQRFRQRPASRRVEIHESPIDGVSVLAIRGELDAQTAPRVAAAIASALQHVPMGLIVDLLQLRFLSSAGMTALVDGDREARRIGKRFGVVADGSATSRPMTLTGVHHVLDLYATVHAAMKGLHQLADSDDAGS
jgi:anti-sigma B factor antagonist